jgi:hypothetical protein
VTFASSSGGGDVELGFNGIASCHQTNKMIDFKLAHRFFFHLRVCTTVRQQLSI